MNQWNLTAQLVLGLDILALTNTLSEKCIIYQPNEGLALVLMLHTGTCGFNLLF